MRTLLLVVLLLVVPAGPAYAQSDLSIEILRDCAEDDIIDGDYSASEMRQAIEDMPGEMDEYAPCRDILSREIAARVGGSSPDPKPTAVPDVDGGSGASGGSAAPSPSPGVTTDPQPTPTPRTRDPGIRIGPSTPEDWKAIDRASRAADEPIEVEGRPVAADASVGRNHLPGTVIAVLALLAALTLSVTVPSARRRLRSRRAA